MGREVGRRIDIAVEGKRLGKNCIGLALAEIIAPHHQIEHNALAILDGLKISEGIERRRLLRNPGQKSRFGARQVGGMFGKIGLRAASGP